MSTAWLIFKKSAAQTWKRLLLTMLAVAIAVTLLLLFVSALNGLAGRSSRGAWIYSIDQVYMRSPQTDSSRQDALIARGFMGFNNLNIWQNQQIKTISVFPTGPEAPSIPGFTWPAEGQYYISPALLKIMKAEPSTELGIRFGKENIGLIPDRMIVSPDDLTVIRGMSESEAANTINIRIHAFGKTSNFLIYIVIYCIGVAILLFPFLNLLIIAVQLGSAQREQRYAAMRLVGATRRQVNQVILFESGIAAVFGAVVGWLFYLVARIGFLQIPSEGRRFWPEDVTVHPWQMFVVFLLALALTLIANHFAMRQVQISPLGVSRRQKMNRPPSILRFIPLIIGLAAFFGARIASPKDQAGYTAQFVVMGSVIVVMLGLVLAGPWITYTLATLLGKNTSRTNVLLSSRRISLHSQQVFRAVSGLVLALFAASFFLTAISGIVANQVNPKRYGFVPNLQKDWVEISGVDLTDSQLDSIANLSYVGDRINGFNSLGTYYIVSCEELTRISTLRCEDGHLNDQVGISIYDVGTPYVYAASKEELLKKLAARHPDWSEDKPYLAAFFNVQPDNFDKLRTDIAKMLPNPTLTQMALLHSEIQFTNVSASSIVQEMTGYTYLGIAVTMAVALLGTIISTIGGLLERRRSLTTLRLGGMTSRELKRLITIESLIPLLSSSLLAAALGLLIGFYLMEMVSASIDAVISPVFLLTLAGLVAVSVISILFILPMVDKITNLAENRTE